ncbi:RabGAP TBC [Pisolithus croceorrhizus]|nr:RabGAP TBC [Pisolithus croceorrhizus]KAI6162505.1 RabGAP TBC [Pisolithus thermaeus]
MAERSARPSVQLIQSVYRRLFHDGTALSKLRDTISQGRLQSNHGNTVGVPGRSLAWKMFLLRGLEPLERPSDEMPSVPIDLLRESRKQFSELLLEKMRAPDGSYDESFVVPGLTIPRRSNQIPLNLETNNPLSLHEENPWKEWFAAMDLRKIIQQDVERTFPDMGYFRSDEVQHQLTNVLFLYSAMHPDIGYRQGMHELLAPLFYAIDFDSVPEAHEVFETDSLFAEFCSRSWVAADSWALFSAIMQKVSQWYEWREPALPPAACGPITLKPYVPPIVEACNRIQGNLLKSVDPTLYEAMQGAGIEPQIYGLRWLRLLFTREFPMDEAMMLWDGLFASSSPTPSLVLWLCVAMLIRIRTKLIPSDYSTQLTYLLRYPPCPAPDPGAPHHIVLLIRHATALEISPSPATGATLMMENRNMLNIPLDVPDPPVARRRPRQAERTHQAMSPETSNMGTTGSQAYSPQLSFPELLARGLLDRGESLGINRTVMNAVSELKRNLPDLTSTLVRSPPFATSSFSAYPLLDEKSPEERYTRDHRSDLESARELADLRRQNKCLGEAVGWVLDTLGQESASDTYQSQRKQALESLSYVRDVLTGQVEEVDERRLWGEAEFKKRWEFRQKSPPPSSESSTTGRDMRSGGKSAKWTTPRENRRYSQGTTGSSSIPTGGNPRSITATTSQPTRTPLLPATHNRSQSSASVVQGSTRADAQRTPFRVSANNPFQRASGGSNVVQDTPGVRSEAVGYDPLGVSK